MSASMDYPDFLERLQQLTDMEAVKEAYLAFVAVSFSTYRVLKTPPEAVVPGSVIVANYSAEMRLQGITRSDEMCIFDELVCVVGRKNSLGPELGQWMERPRKATLSRLQDLLLVPERPEQTAFLNTVRRWTQDPERVFTAILMEVGSSEGLADVLASHLPPGARAFKFSATTLAALAPRLSLAAARLFIPKAYVDLGKIMKGLDCGRVAAASVAPWPGDAPDGPQFVQALQQGLQDAKRLECGMAPHIVYTSDWYSYGGHTEDGGGAGG